MCGARGRPASPAIYCTLCVCHGHTRMLHMLPWMLLLLVLLRWCGGLVVVVGGHVGRVGGGCGICVGRCV